MAVYFFKARFSIVKAIMRVIFFMTCFLGMMVSLSSVAYSAIPAEDYLKIESDMISVFKRMSPFVVNINSNPTSSSDGTERIGNFEVAGDAAR